MVALGAGGVGGGDGFCRGYRVYLAHLAQCAQIVQPQISLGVIDMKAAIATDAGEQPATVGADARQCGAERIGRGIEHQLRLTKRELPGIETTAIDIVAYGGSEAYLILIFRRKDTKKSPLYQIQGEIFEECNKKGLYLTN